MSASEVEVPSPTCLLSAPRFVMSYRGWRQRAAQAREAELGPERGSFLVHLLVREWTWGYLPAYKVQQYAAAAVKDGSEHPDLLKLSRVGSAGRNPQTCKPDLERLLQSSEFHIAIETFEIPLKRGAFGTAMVGQAILLPHVLFSVMYHHYRDAFDKYILGSAGRVAQFWADMRGNPQYDDHPMRRRRDHGTKAIPIAIHGDGLPCIGVGKTWQKSFEAFSWSSLTGTGKCTLLMNWLIWLFPKDLVAKFSRVFFLFEEPCSILASPYMRNAFHLKAILRVHECVASHAHVKLATHRHICQRTHDKYIGIRVCILTRQLRTYAWK